MNKIYLSTDWHLVKYDKESGRSWIRPDVDLIKENLQIIKEGDTFIFLGDLQDSEISDIAVVRDVIKSIPKGVHKILIRGNNDTFSDLIYEQHIGFNEVLWAKFLKLDNTRILLSHTSVDIHGLSANIYNIHGHIHRPGVNISDIPYYHDPTGCYNICSHDDNNAGVYNLEDIIPILKHTTNWGSRITGKMEKPGMSRLCQSMAFQVLFNNI
jgi:calcineurin-like phosphoesterase family protein